MRSRLRVMDWLRGAPKSCGGTFLTCQLPEVFATGTLKTCRHSAFRVPSPFILRFMPPEVTRQSFATAVRISFSLVCLRSSLGLVSVGEYVPRTWSLWAAAERTCLSESGLGLRNARLLGE